MFRRRKPEETAAPAPSSGKTGTNSPDQKTPSTSGGNAIFPERQPASTDARPTSQAKDSAAMGRTPFPAPPSNTPPTAPGTRPGVPGAPAAAVGARRDTAERRTLVVGRGISVQGTVQDAERLVVEGTVEASMIHATELSVAQGGVFRGEIEVEDAELAGTIDGTLTVRGNLIVRASGRLIGKTKTRRLQVEDGGQITGHLEMITDGAARPPVGEPVATSRPATEEAESTAS